MKQGRKRPRRDSDPDQGSDGEALEAEDGEQQDDGKVGENPNEASSNPQQDDGLEAAAEGINDSQLSNNHASRTAAGQRSRTLRSLMPGGLAGKDAESAINQLGRGTSQAARDAEDRDRNLPRPEASEGSLIDSHAFADSSSSSDGDAAATSTPISTHCAHQGAQPPVSFADQCQRVQPQPPAKDEEQGEKGELSQLQQMLQRKKGFDIMDGVELFQLLHSPNFNEWKAKRDEVAQKLAKKGGKGALSGGHGGQRLYAGSSGQPLQYASRWTGEMGRHLGQALDPGLAGFDHVGGGMAGEQQREQYYMKEVRTFDEVYKSIKAKVKEQQARRVAKQRRREQYPEGNGGRRPLVAAGSEDDVDDEDEDGDGLDGDEDRVRHAEDSGNELEALDGRDAEQEALDEQGIDDQDREVLNDRILGIINVFQHVVQSNNSQQQLAPKQLKALQDLGRKNLSIEKAHHHGGASSERKQRKTRDNQAQSQKLDGPGGKGGASRENLDEPAPRRAIGGAPAGLSAAAGSLLHACRSSKELSFGTCVTKRPPAVSHGARKRRIGTTEPMLAGSSVLPPY